jgi:hypothetical protein
MHVGWTAHFYREAKRDLESAGVRKEILVADWPGDRWLVRSDGAEPL